jgi:hypothetical protein
LEKIKLSKVSHQRSEAKNVAVEIQYGGFYEETCFAVSCQSARLADRKANLAKKGIPFSFKKLVRKIRIIQTTKQPVTVKDLAINGKDLIDLGLRPGPLFGKFLNNALELVLEQPEQNQKEILLEFAKREFEK